MATDNGVQIGAAANMKSRTIDAARRCRVLQTSPTTPANWVCFREHGR